MRRASRCQIPACRRPGSYVISFSSSHPPAPPQDHLIQRADELDHLLHGILLGFDGSLTFPGTALTEALTAPRRTETVALGDAVAERPWPIPVNTTTRDTMLWSLVRAYNSHMRVVGMNGFVDRSSLPVHVKVDFEQERRYLLLNGPTVLFDGLAEARKCASIRTDI